MFTIDIPTNPNPSNGQGGYIGDVPTNPNEDHGWIGEVETAENLDEAGIPESQTITLIDGTSANYFVYALDRAIGAIALITDNDNPITLASGPPTADDPLEEGEYWYDPYSQIIILGSTPEAGAVRIRGRLAAQVRRDRVCDLPQIFRWLDICKTLDISVDLGGHPSGSFTVRARQWNLEAVKQALCIGTEITVMGLGLRVKGLQQTEHRQAIGNEYEIAVALGGKWERLADEPIPWRSRIIQTTDEFGQYLPSVDNDGGSAIAASIVRFAERASIPYNGVDLTVSVASNSTSEDTTTFASILSQERAATKGRFIDWSDPSGVHTPAIDSVGSWSLGPSEIFEAVGTVGYAGIGDRRDFVPSPDLRIPTPDPNQVGNNPCPTLHLKNEANCAGWAIKFPNILLTGEFSEEPTTDDSEPTQDNSEAPPQWRQREPIVETFEEGDINPSAPPTGVSAIRDLSVLFSVSGVNKVAATTTKQYGITTLVVTEKWGFVFTADQVATSNADGSYAVNASPAAFWQRIERATTTTLIDSKTGYVLGSDTSGWTTARFKEESAQSPETLSDISDAEKALYRFFALPIVGRERILLKRHQDHYPNIRNAERYEYYKITLPDGTSAYRRVDNPNFAPSMFVSAIASETRAFAETLNPNPVEDQRDILFTGKEEFFNNTITVQSGSDRIISSGDVDQQREAELAAQDRYTEWSVSNANQGEGFKDYAADKKFREMSGRPGVADKLPDIFERVPPDSDEPPPVEETEDGYITRYFVRTPPYTSLSPIGGSTSVATARTRRQAETAIATLAYIDQLKNGTTDSIQAPWGTYRPGDRLTYVSMRERRQRRILGVKWVAQVVSPGVVRGRCVLKLGRDVDPRPLIEFGRDRVPNPSEQQDSLDEGHLQTFNDTIVRRPGFELGSVLDRLPEVNIKGRLQR